MHYTWFLLQKLELSRQSFFWIWTMTSAVLQCFSCPPLILTPSAAALSCSVRDLTCSFSLCVKIRRTSEIKVSAITDLLLQLDFLRCYLMTQIHSLKVLLPFPQCKGNCNTTENYSDQNSDTIVWFLENSGEIIWDAKTQNKLLFMSNYISVI